MRWQSCLLVTAGNQSGNRQLSLRFVLNSDQCSVTGSTSKFHGPANCQRAIQQLFDEREELRSSAKRWAKISCRFAVTLFIETMLERQQAIDLNNRHVGKAADALKAEASV